MIYVLTVHWRSPQWVAPQLEYLHRNIASPFRVFAVLNGIDDRELWNRFDHAEDLKAPHGEKLNALAGLVVDQASPDDIIVFLDSDAFPIRSLDGWLSETLRARPLIAIQRRENFEDLRPHPSFCATTVRCWNRIGGDWGRELWTTPSGAVLDDAGTRVLHSLEAHGVDWLPLTRSNTRDAHPLWFGVYGHYIYHHGAGSRTKWSVLDDQKVFTPASLQNPSLGSLSREVRSDPRALLHVRPRDLAVLPAASARSVRQIRKRLLMLAADRQSDRVFRRLIVDPAFYREFDESVPETASGSPDRH
jgi:hypothetical protein